jgi:hypothetical protein
LKTEPLKEKEAKQNERDRKQSEKPKDPLLEKVGEAEAGEHAARRQVEEIRELLALIRDHVTLPDDIVAKIDAVLQN